MADTAAHAVAQPTVTPQRDPAASKKTGPTGPVVAPAVNGVLGALYNAGPSLSLAPGVQCKLVVGPPDDPFEREADRVAERVTAGGPAMRISRLPAGGGTTDFTEDTDQKAVRRQVDEEEQVQPKARSGVIGIPRISARTAAAIDNPGAGQPIAPDARRRIEPYLGADLGGARIHTGMAAQRAASSLHARAFTHRQHIFLGYGESPNNLPLLAHEATHVVQQGTVALQRTPLLSAGLDQVQRLPSFIAEELASYARYIPGYSLFTVIIGYNPLLGERVERNATNLLQGLLGLTPAGTFIFDKLNEYGIIQDAFAWVEGELARLDLSIERIERTVEAAWEDVRLIEGFDYNLAVLRRHFGALYDDVVSFAASLVSHILEMIKEAVVGVAEGLLAENQAWALLKKVLHYDPLRGEPVEATTEEILADFLLLIGKETELAQMQERGTLAETAAWLDTQFAIFTGLIAELGSLFSAAWDAIQPENLPDLASNVQNLVANVGSFLQRVWDFASTVALKVLELIKQSLLGWLSSFADEVPGFHLVTVILGRNPFTEEAVPRTAENIIRGFITLLPGGNATYEQLAETGTIAQAAAAIEGAMAELGISWELITGIFSGIWDSLTIDDLLDPIGAFTRIVEQFGEPISRLFAFIRVVLRELFTLILQLMNFPSDLIGSIIANAMQAFESIKNDPIGFFKNMLATVKQGFSQFFDNILQHLVGGLVDWLFRGLREAGIEPPADLSLASILDFVLQVLGISMERIWQKLAEHVGQETVDRIRGAVDRLVGIWTFVRDVQERGVAAIWEYIEGQISGLWDMVLEQARNWIMERIVTRAIQWLLSLLDPTGIMPVINSFLAFFRAVQSAIDYLRDILAIINDYVSTIAAIARGEIAAGADRLEQGLANAIPVAIGFLANQFGLGRIGDKIAEIVGGIRGLVDRALDWLIERAVSAVQSLLRTLGFGGENEDATVAADVDPTDHEAYARSAADLLKAEPLTGHDSPLAAAQAFAAEQEPILSARLEPGIGLRFVFNDQPDELADGDLDFNVVIAPNTTTVAGSIPVCPSPGGSAPGIGSETVHGSQPQRNRNGPRIHHTQSEHIIPFATARSLRLAVGLTERSRAVLRQFDHGMITLMIYRGAAEGKNAQDNVYSAQFEADMTAARIPETTEQARQQYATGNEDQAEALGREVVSSVVGALETLRRSAVTRTQQEILAEWSATEDGCTQTNGQRRAEANAVPDNAAVEGAADRQLDGIIDLVTEALLANGST